MPERCPQKMVNHETNVELLQALWNMPKPVVARTPAQIAAQDAEDAKVLARADLEKDAVLQYLKAHSAAETYAYVQTHVTDLATAKDLVGKLAVVVGVLLR